MARAAETNARLVLVGRKVAEPWRFGVMRFDGEGRLVGVYYFAPDIFRCIHDTPPGETDDQLERAYQLLIDRGQAAHVAYDGLFESYKYPWNLLTISDLLLRQHITEPRISPSARISERAVIEGNVLIEEGVRVFEYAVVRGPAYIGAGSIIGNSSMVWGGCSLGAGCVVGFGSEIKHSVFGRNVWTHRNYVGDSVVSDNCSFGAGTITANWRFDSEAVTVRVGDGRVSTGTDKFGVIMAEGCRTGSNSVLMPGVKIGPNSIVGPGVTLLDDLPPNKIALPTRACYEVRDNRLDLTGGMREDYMKSIAGRIGTSGKDSTKREEKTNKHWFTKLFGGINAKKLKNKEVLTTIGGVALGIGINALISSLSQEESAILGQFTEAWGRLVVALNTDGENAEDMSNAINQAFYKRRITREEKDNLHKIRHIRNAIQHSKTESELEQAINQINAPMIDQLEKISRRLLSEQKR
ncbi:MAG: hypothetical protein D6796_13360 [Caldilineae bacterium]|nr:MAG: hypothetical protein D6796_13360 [Caldilineae bacterium]